MAAGIATFDQLKTPGIYDILENRSLRLEKGLNNVVAKSSVDALIQRVGSMLGMFFTNRQVENFNDAKTCNQGLYSDFYKGMLEEGVYLAPSQFESIFVSLAHDEDDIDQTLSAVEKVLDVMTKKDVF